MCDEAMTAIGCTVVPGGVGNTDTQVQLMAELKKEAASVGCKFLMYYVPLKHEVYSGKEHPSPQEHNLHVISRRHDIGFIPTLKMFRKQAELLKVSGKRLYWQKDSHWTPEGHHLTGLILTEYILSHREEYGLE